MATALAVVSVLGAVAGAVQQKKIGEAQKKQNKLSNKIAAVSRQRDVKRSIASARVRSAEAQAAGFQLGVSGGTAVSGATAGIASDTSSTVGQSNLQSTGSGFVAGLQNKISGFQSNQATFGAVSSIAGGLSQNDKAIAGLEDFFGVA